MTEALQWVRLKGQPSRTALATDARRARAGVMHMQVEFPDGTRSWWPVDRVENAPKVVSRQSAIERGEFGQVTDLRRALMIERLKGDLTDNFYSMGSSDTEFYPHQFKPVLRFVESPTGRHLIADEVGLGKTIEALLIWKELEARTGARRLLIVCPSVLREKWRAEMRKRFRVMAAVTNSAELLEALRSADVDRSHGFALIASYEALRPPKSADEYDANQRVSPRENLRRFLDVKAGAGEPLIDLVVVDEAHYARNAATANNKLVHALNEIAAHMVLVSATPVQISTDNLYQLLRIIDPDTFGESYLFDRLLADNEPLIRAQRALLSQAGKPSDVLEVLRSSNVRSPLIEAVQEQLAHAGALLTPDQRVSLARSLERISLLAPVMTRTRKRDIFENRVVRQPQVIKVTMNARERAIYDQVSEFILAWYDATRDDGDRIGRLALVTRQRQMASCIPAALQRIAERHNVDPESMYEDFGTLVEEADTGDLPSETNGVGDPLTFEEASQALVGFEDSKLAVLREFLTRRHEVDPLEKFVLFSFFRGTLTYLSEKLQPLGIRVFLLVGGGSVDKDATLQAFRDFDGPAVLLSSEVGSEGVDLQFCRTLINYDLPWNPMRLEQRIGRLDRIGQDAELITIVNFSMEETIEDRVLTRLYERIGIFEQSIGDTEQILGADIQRLIDDLYRSDLSEAQREARAQLNVEAIARRIQEADSLEEQASNLIAFNDYLTNQIKSGADLGRFVEPTALRAFAVDFLAESYPGTVVQSASPDGAVFELALSSDAKADLAQFIERMRPPRRTTLAQAGPAVTMTVNPKLALSMKREPEVLDVTHPLVLWMREQLKSRAVSTFPVSAIELDKSLANGLAPGIYVYAVDRMEFEGARREVTLRFGAVDLGCALRLGSQDAERLVRQSSIHGVSISSDELSPAREAITVTANHLFDQLADEGAEALSLLEAENQSMIERRLDAVRAESIRRIGERQARLNNAENSGDPAVRRAIPLRRQELNRAKEVGELQIRRLNDKRNPRCEYTQSLAGLVWVR